MIRFSASREVNVIEKTDPQGDLVDADEFCGYLVKEDSIFRQMTSGSQSRRLRPLESSNMTRGAFMTR
jgi:hypothetical protein